MTVYRSYMIKSGQLFSAGVIVGFGVSCGIALFRWLVVGETLSTALGHGPEESFGTHSLPFQNKDSLE